MRKLLFLLLFCPLLGIGQLHQVVCDGNSLTDGYGSSTGLHTAPNNMTGMDYPAQLSRSLSTGFQVLNFGVSGQTTTQMSSDAATQIDPLFNATAYGQNILVAWEITNDVQNGQVSWPQAYQNFKNYCLARKAAGWKIVVLTVLPRQYFGPDDVIFEVGRIATNTLLRLEWPQYADAIADVGDLAMLRPDGIHTDDAGYGIVATAVKHSIQSLVQPVPVPENTLMVTTVTPTGPILGAINYSVTGGADAAKFQINASTGVLTFLHAPDYDVPTDIDGDNVYEVTVRASNGIAINDQSVKAEVIANNVLPLRFINLSAVVKNNAVQVEWQVAASATNTVYEVERSADGQQFNKLAAVNSPANTLSFNWVDANPANGISYYRIKAIEPSGLNTYSAMVKVNTGASGSQFSIFPNPVRNSTFNLQLTNSPKGTYRLAIVDRLGQLVYRQDIVYNGGTSSQAVYISQHISPGMYQVQLTSGEYRQVQQVVVSQ